MEGDQLRARLDVQQIGKAQVVVASRQQAVSEIIDAVGRRSRAIFGFCNAHTVVTAEHNAQFSAAIASITLFNDGIGIDLARRMLCAVPFPENLNGTDLTPDVLEALPAGARVYLLGSAPSVAETAARRLGDKYPAAQFIGCNDGFFLDEQSAGIAENIGAKGTDLLLIGMGHPRQELWATQWGPSTGAVALCVGAFLDFAAGEVARAPNWVRTLRLEWVYRLITEPRRLAGRYLIGNLQFFGIILRQKSTRGPMDQGSS